MRYEVTVQQLKAFHEDNEILFEEFLKEDEVALIRSLSCGEELWKENPLLKKLLISKQMGDLFLELIGCRPIRLIFDIMTPPGFTLNLQELPIQGILGGFIIEKNEHSATFFRGDQPLNIPEPSYVALYGETNSRYIDKKNTPFSYRLKKLGYASGDRLKPEDFPLVR